MRQPHDDHSRCGHRGHPFGSRTTAVSFFTAVLAAMLSIVPGPAFAATEVRGQPADMQLRADNASTREVLNALATAFKLTYQLPPNIGRQVTGLYAGTLHQVLARILDGNDYIVKVSDSGVEVVVLGTSGATAVAPAGAVIPVAGPAIAATSNAVAPQGAPSEPTPPPLTDFLPAQGPTVRSHGGSRIP